jgi:Icc-related predicted phosphoesterase
MNLAHFSDLHGRLELIDIQRLPARPDYWVSTGDFFPNQTYGNRAVEVAFQTAWFHQNADEIFARLAGIPVVVVDGTPAGADLGPGVRVAGFRHIPYIQGRWAGEIQQADFVPMIRRALNSGANVLVTHAPPAGILDGGGDGFGIRPLTSMLMYPELGDHTVTHHLFGHIHEAYGSAEVCGIRFFNSAQGLQWVRFEEP